MRIRDFPLLTDENIAPEIVAFLRGEEFDVVDVVENGWQGEDDGDILAKALAEGRVVISHDTDFGTLTLRDRFPFVSIIRLWPGHISSAETIASLQELLVEDPDLDMQFLIVVRLTSNGIRIRTRRVDP